LFIALFLVTPWLYKMPQDIGRGRTSMHQLLSLSASVGDQTDNNRGDVGDDDGSRREVLAKFGRFAYAAPALVLLTEPGAAQEYGKSPRPKERKPREPKPKKPKR
jgi:hypothetical protein